MCEKDATGEGVRVSKKGLILFFNFNFILINSFIVMICYLFYIIYYFLIFYEKKKKLNHSPFSSSLLPPSPN